MIKKRTVFVIGAGASFPFGFPVGAGLRHEIIASSGTDLVSHCAVSRSGFDEFQRDFRRSGFSIDRFLAHRPEYDKIGVLAIANALLPKEVDSKLHEADTAGDSDWYQLLWHRMTDGVTEANDLLGNAVRFITFNYDRSLERYLHLTAAGAFGMSDDEAYELVKKFLPHHVYGSLGEYRRHPGIYSYGGAAPQFQTAAAGLRVMPNARPHADRKCIDDLEWAQQVFFVGFAFDPLNCARLGAPAVFTPHSPSERVPELLGTAMDFKKHERDKASELLTGQANRVRFLDMSALEAMREWAPFM